MKPSIQPGVWKEGSIAVSLVTLGTRTSRLFVTGLEISGRNELPRFKQTLLRIGKECLPSTNERDFFVVLADGHRWTEFLEFTASDLSQAGVQQVTIVDNGTGIPIRALNGTADSAKNQQYDLVRSNASVSGFHAEVSVPEGYERLNLSELTEEMRVVAKIAASIYKPALRRIIIFRDAGLRMALTFATTDPSSVATLLYPVRYCRRILTTKRRAY